MSTTCLVNCYNYQRFVGEAIESALAQTVPFDEILVVDDGSTDGSAELVRDRFGHLPNVRLIAKSNGGQLSCLNAGLQAARGDIVCLLDADDLYEAPYLEQLLGVYAQSPRPDCVLTAHRKFGQRDELGDVHHKETDLGYSVILTYCLKKRLAVPTSCLSVRRELLKPILPIPLEEDWRISADSCLAFAVSLLGGRKYRLMQPFVRYRVHADNRYLGQPCDREREYRVQLAENRLFAYVMQKTGLETARLAELADREFYALPEPSFKQLRDYTRVPWRSSLRLPLKLKLLYYMARYYFFGVCR